MKDPYSILGISPDASSDELKARYEELKAKYSEGRFAAGEEGNEAAKNSPNSNRLGRIFRRKRSSPKKLTAAAITIISTNSSRITATTRRKPCSTA